MIMEEILRILNILKTKFKMSKFKFLYYNFENIIKDIQIKIFIWNSS